MKTGIQKKSIRFVLVVVGIMAIALTVAGFLSVWKMRFDTIGQRQKQDAVLFSTFITLQIEHTVSNLGSYVVSPWWRDALDQANLTYVNWNPQAIQKYMARMDEEWVSAPFNSPVIQERLGSRMSQRLKILADQDVTIAKMLLTDKYGGLVASSNRSSDFYQADEDWWQRAYNKGQGAIFWGGVELDPSSQKISCPVAIPVKDQTGQVIGVLKTSLDISVFFQSLLKYQFGKTGHVSLLNEQGDVIYHPGLAPMSKFVLSGPDLGRLLRSKNGFEIVKGCTGKMALVSASRVQSPYLETNGIHWIIFVAQEQDEISYPLYMIFAGSLVFVLIISSGIVFFMRKMIRDVFIAPLLRIQEGVRHFSKGDLDHRIDLKTADEFELLATSLNEAAGHLKETMVSKDKLLSEIERRQQLEKDLIESEKRFIDVMYASPDAILLIAGDKFVDSNEATARMLGYASREDFLMTHPSQLSPPRQPDGQSSFEKANEMMKIAAERGSHRFEWVHRKANGEDFLVEVSLTPIVIKGKTVLHCVWIDLTRKIQDEEKLKLIQLSLTERSEQLGNSLKEAFKSREILTSMLEDNNEATEKLKENIRELKRSQSMLIHSEKLASLGRLVSEIAHEVNNPLMIISGNAQLSLMSAATSDKEKKSAGKIVKECERAKEVIRRVLRFARPSKGEVKDVNIIQSIEAVACLLEKQYMLNNNVEIKRDYLTKDIYIPVDDLQLQEVFMNLLNNAKEAMPHGGVVTITTSLEGDFLKIDFKDTGEGMTEEVMHKIMEPFFTTKETGTGIGLAVCYGIIKVHGGEIKFESELGKGTTATILLPLAGGGKS